MEEIKIILEGAPSGRYQRLKGKNLLGKLKELTSFLDEKYENVQNRQRFWHIINNAMYIIICRECGKNPAKYHPSHGYNTCSNKCKFEQSKKTNQKKYGADWFILSEEGRKIAKKTNKEKYGTEHHSQSKHFIEKSVKTNKEKYGTDWYQQTDEYKEQSKKTNQKKYGVDYITQSESFKKKSIETIMSKYGVDNNAKSVESKKKTKETNKERYGVDNFSKTEEFKIKSKKTNMDKYGVDNIFKTSIIIDMNNNRYKDILLSNLGKEYELIDCGSETLYIKHIKCGNNFKISRKLHNSRRNKLMEICLECHPVGCNFSKDEKEVLNFVKSIYSDEIIENSRKIIHPYEIDIYLPKLKFAIEFNGTYHHADPRFYNADPRFYNADTMIYYKLAEEVWQRDKIKDDRCKNKNINLFVIWEHDWTNNRKNIEEKLQKFFV